MRHVIVVDLGYGDAGKGTIVDWLSSPAGLDNQPAAVIRFSGGAQAAHNVVTPDGRAHTFAQFGAGTLHGVPTLLSRHMFVEPLALAKEATALTRLGVPAPFGLLSVDVDALLTTPYHAAVNRAREVARGRAAHGTCGVGIGETAAYAFDDPHAAPTVGDTMRPPVLRRKLAQLRDWTAARVAELDDASIADLGMPSVDALLDTYRAFAERVALVDRTALAHLTAQGSLIFEGSQGILLDEDYGFFPHATRSKTTVANAVELLDEAGVDTADRSEVTRLGVTRTYATRHGAGPLVSEDATLSALLPEPHNANSGWQGRFRVGHLDLVTLRYAVEVNDGIDQLAITHLDTAIAAHHREPGTLRVVSSWQTPWGTLERLTPATRPNLDYQRTLTALAFSARPNLVDTPDDWPALLRDAIDVPVMVESAGPTWLDKHSQASHVETPLDKANSLLDSFIGAPA